MRKILALLILLAIPAVAQFGGPMGGMRPGSMQGGGLLPGRGGDPLWVAAGPTKPKLDLDFAKRKDLTDAVSGKTSLVTFSRSAAQSPGTYVGSDGLIHDAAVNLALYSEQFDNAAWIKSNATVSANQTIAPDEKQTADLFYPTATGSFSYLSQNFTGTNVFTISAFVKAAGKNVVWGYLRNSALYGRIDFDLSDQSFQVVSGSTSTPTGAIEAIGNGWFKISVTSGSPINLSGGGSGFGVSDSKGSLSVTANGKDGIYLWGTQLEETDPATMAPTAYIHTTSQALAAPRFDHDPVTGESLGLLVEEQRANAFTESEFRNGYVADSAKRGGLLSDVSFSGLFNNTGVAFGHDGATASYVYKLGVATSSTVTFSVFVRMDDGAPPSFGSSSITNSSNDFVLNLGGSVPSPLTYSVEDYGNGMHRVFVTATSGAIPENTGVLKYGSNSSRTFKVSGYQVENSASFHTSYIPTTSSAQTRYADIAAVQDEDFATTNLLSYSESFDVGWTPSGVTINDDVAQAPDGTLTADEVVASTGFGAFVNRWFQSVSGSGKTISIYAKANTAIGILVRTLDGNDGNSNITFDLSNGTVDTISGSGHSSYSIASAGNGWYRISVTSTTTYTQAYFAVAGAGLSNGKSIYVWGASLTATEYPVAYTTTRNLVTDSQDFERSRWLKTRATIEDDIAQAPDGTLTADKLKEDSSPSNTHRIDTPTDISAISGQSYVFTAYAKSAGRDWLAIQLQSAFGGGYAYFDLSNGTIGANTTLSESITSAGDGWYRISITVNAVSTGTGAASFVLAAGNNVPSYNGDGTSGVLLWGSQLEPGTTATDYVRTVDVVGKAYQWFEPTEGTVFVEAQAAKQGFGGQLWFNRDETSNRGWSVVNGTTTDQRVYFRADDNSLKNLFLGSVTASSVNKISSAIDADDVRGVMNGGTVQSAALTAYYAFNKLRIGYQFTAGGGIPLNGHIKRLTYWPVRQSDTTLQVITQ